MRYAIKITVIKLKLHTPAMALDAHQCSGVEKCKLMTPRSCFCCSFQSVGGEKEILPTLLHFPYRLLVNKWKHFVCLSHSVCITRAFFTSEGGKYCSMCLLNELAVGKNEKSNVESLLRRKLLSRMIVIVL